MKKPRLSTVIALVIVPVLTAAVIVAFVRQLQVERRRDLLNQFSGIVGPKNDAVVTDDDVLIHYIRTYGPAPAMHELKAATVRLGVECHDRAHELGRMSFEEFGDEVLKLNLPECHSGFYHGAIEAYFREHGTDRLKEKLSFICPPDLNLFFSHQCRHGLGHGLMAWSNYDLPATLDFCNLIDDDGGKASCRTGAYMENIVGSLAESPEARARGHFTKYLSEDPQYPCNAMKEEYKADCYFLQTDRMHFLGKSFQAVADGCAAAPEAYQYTCYASMGRTVSGMSRGRPQQIVDSCGLIADDRYRALCVDAAAKDQLWDPSGRDAGLALCALFTDPADSRSCYLGLLYHAAFVLDDEQRREFCPQFPEEFRSQCAAGRADPDPLPPAV